MDIQSAFKLYDIRGPFPKVVDENLAFLVGLAFGKLKKPKKALVGSDIRDSSPILKKFLADGMRHAGVDVYDLLEVSSPQFNFSVATGIYDAGIMVTASHVKSDENGFKFVNSKGLPLDQGEILELKEAVIKLKGEKILHPSPPIETVNTTKDYIAALVSRIPPFEFDDKFTLVLDTTKSSVASVVHGVFKHLKIKHRFIKANHEGNPLLYENRKAIKKDILANGGDLGILWDSDGDRVVFVDNRGELIPFSFVLGLLAAQEIRHRAGKKAIVDVRAGLVVRDLIEEAGGKLEVSPAWHQPIQFLMESDKSVVFGGETSGHIMFADFYKIDDGILTALKFLKIASAIDFNDKIKELRGKYFELPEKNFPCPNEIAPASLERLTEFYRGKNYRISLLDGLTVFGPSWKINLRESLTEPFLRLNLEAKNAAEAEKIILEIENHLNL